MASSSVPSSFC